MHLNWIKASVKKALNWLNSVYRVCLPALSAPSALPVLPARCLPDTCRAATHISIAAFLCIMSKSNKITSAPLTLSPLIAIAVIVTKANNNNNNNFPQELDNLMLILWSTNQLLKCRVERARAIPRYHLLALVKAKLEINYANKINKFDFALPCRLLFSALFSRDCSEQDRFLQTSSTCERQTAADCGREEN